MKQRESTDDALRRQALLLSHPHKLVRDTARFPPLMRPTAPGRRAKPRALRHLAVEHLGLTIQVPPLTRAWS